MLGSSPPPPFTSLEPPRHICFSLTRSYSFFPGFFFFFLQLLKQTKPTHDLMHSNSQTCMRTRRCLLSCTQMCWAGEGTLAGGGTLHLPCMDLSTAKTHFALKLQNESSHAFTGYINPVLLSPINVLCSLKKKLKLKKVQCDSKRTS